MTNKPFVVTVIKISHHLYFLYKNEFDSYANDNVYRWNIFHTCVWILFHMKTQLHTGNRKVGSKWRLDWIYITKIFARSIVTCKFIFQLMSVLLAPIWLIKLPILSPYHHQSKRLINIYLWREHTTPDHLCWKVAAK